jgi:hypothetical protein
MQVKEDFKTIILKIKGDWTEVVDDCRATVSKPPLGHEPSGDFRRDILIAEHSPIRGIRVKWSWHSIKSWIATHWSRHKWECFISSQRSDRTGIPRDKLPQDVPVDFTGEANAQALIDTMRKRLCRRASPETRAYAEDFKRALREVEPELSDVLVPNCVYRCGCPEMDCCGEWQRMCRETNQSIDTGSIKSIAIGATTICFTAPNKTKRRLKQWLLTRESHPTASPSKSPIPPRA